MAVKVLSVGGSIIAPEFPDSDFLKLFCEMIRRYLNQHKEDKLILVAGGGGPARIYQKAFSIVLDSNNNYDSEAADWIGIMATRLNAQLLKACFGDLCQNQVVTDPTAVTSFNGSILIAAGWKPGFSTDNDAVLLAEKFNADTVVNLSNIEKVYTDDPRKNKNAQPLDEISWASFRKMVGDDWIPGKNTPFDPIASKKAENMKLTVICANGKDIKNTQAILEGKPYTGTTIK